MHEGSMMAERIRVLEDELTCRLRKRAIPAKQIIYKGRINNEEAQRCLQNEISTPKRF